MVKCSKCGVDIIAHTDFTPGYGRYGKRKRIICYGCCGKMDEKQMDKHGRIALYLTPTKEGGWCGWKVGNWPGTLEFKVTGHYFTNHYTPGVCYQQKKHHVWFTDHKGHKWYGYQIGDTTQICHCRRLKG